MKQTENYNLTLYEPNDITAYMSSSGWNGTMEKIDAALHAIDVEVTEHNTDLTTLEQQMSTANDEINQLTDEVSANTTAISGNTSNIAGLNTRVTTAEANIVALNNTVNATVPTQYVGVLSAGEKTIAITIDGFNENTLALPFTSVWGFVPDTFELRKASGGQPNLAVLTFATAKNNDVRVAVQLYNTGAPSES